MPIPALYRVPDSHMTILFTRGTSPITVSARQGDLQLLFFTEEPILTAESYQYEDKQDHADMFLKSLIHLKRNFNYFH